MHFCNLAGQPFLDIRPNLLKSRIRFHDKGNQRRRGTLVRLQGGLSSILQARGVRNSRKMARRHQPRFETSMRGLRTLLARYELHGIRTCRLTWHGCTPQALYADDEGKIRTHARRKTHCTTWHAKPTREPVLRLHFLKLGLAEKHKKTTRRPASPPTSLAQC